MWQGIQIVFCSENKSRLKRLFWLWLPALACMLWNHMCMYLCSMLVEMVFGERIWRAQPIKVLASSSFKNRFSLSASVSVFESKHATKILQISTEYHHLSRFALLCNQPATFKFFRSSFLDTGQKHIPYTMGPEIRHMKFILKFY